MSAETGGGPGMPDSIFVTLEVRLAGDYFLVGQVHRGVHPVAEGMQVVQAKVGRQKFGVRLEAVPVGLGSSPPGVSDSLGLTVQLMDEPTRQQMDTWKTGK